MAASVDDPGLLGPSALIPFEKKNGNNQNYQEPFIILCKEIPIKQSIVQQFIIGFRSGDNPSHGSRSLIPIARIFFYRFL